MFFQMLKVFPHSSGLQYPRDLIQMLERAIWVMK
jgi:hypothetical protein